MYASKNVSIVYAMGRHNKLDLNHRRQPRSRSRMHDDAQRGDKRDVVQNLCCISTIFAHTHKIAWTNHTHIQFLKNFEKFWNIWYMIHEWHGFLMAYFITFVYSPSAPWQMHLHGKFSDSWVFYGVFIGFSISYRIFEANGMIHEYMVLWCVFGFLWCIL